MTSGTPQQPEEPEEPQNPPTIRQPDPASGAPLPQEPKDPQTPWDQLNPPTIRQPDPANGATGPADSAPGAPNDRDDYFPDRLRAAYEPLERCGRGGEAAVWHARRCADGREVAVKVHWVGKNVDFDLLRHLNQPQFTRCVPELYDFGMAATPYGDVGWVAMELFGVTLDELIASWRETATVLDPARARQIVASLVDTIAFWQDQIDRTPIDLKPDNIGVRADPEQFVIFDFGGVVRHTITQLHGDVLAASGYMAPEGLVRERHPRSPWWSLGVIALEMLTGQSRFRAENGRLLRDAAVRRDLALGEFDLSEVHDERWLLLLHGLLTREPADRWGRDEVRDWLAGGSPPVVRPAGHGPLRPGHAHEPIDFNGTQFREPGQLAAHMLDNSEQAARWLTANAGRLRTWLREEVHDNQFDTGYLLAIEGGAAQHAARVILSFGAAYLERTGVTPRYCGQVISVEGLTAICESGATGVPVLRELVDEDVLGIAARYRCRHRECRPGGRCLRLDRTVAEVPSILSGAAAVVAAAVPAPRRAAIPGAQLSTAERDSLLPIAFLLSLDPADGRRRVLRRVSSIRRLRRAWAVSWWWENYLAVLQADPQTTAGRVSLAAADLVQQRAVATQAARPRLFWLPEVSVRRIRGALVGIVALTLLCWSAAVFGIMVASHDGQVMSHRPEFAAVGRELGGAAATDTFGLLPLFALVVIVCFLTRSGRSLLACCAVGVAGLGFATARVPGFSVITAPHVLAGPMDWFGRKWAQSVGITAVIGAVVAIIAVIVAGNLLRPQVARYRMQPGGGLGERLARLPGGWRRLISGCATFVVVQALLWAAVTVRETVSVPAPPGAAVGEQAAVMQSGLLICSVVLAVLAMVVEAEGARLVLWLSAVGAIVVGGWPQLLIHVRVLWHPVDTAGLVQFAAAWGAGAFWAAALCYLPVAALGMRAALRASERSW